jgi:transcriptional regulator with XRE-family HTH domain
MSNSNHEPQSLNNIGLRIKRARQLAGFSQKELAQFLGLSDKTVSAYEVGRALPGLETLKDLSQVTHQPVSYFVDEEPDDLDLQLRLKKIEQELLEIKKALRDRRETK